LALRPRTLKHVRGGWPHYKNTSEPVASYGANIIVTVQFGIRTSDLIAQRANQLRYPGPFKKTQEMQTVPERF
jgi:hypothetical protein